MQRETGWVPNIAAIIKSYEEDKFTVLKLDSIRSFLSRFSANITLKRIEKGLHVLVEPPKAKKKAHPIKKHEGIHKRIKNRPKEIATYYVPKNSTEFCERIYEVPGKQQGSSYPAHPPLPAVYPLANYYDCDSQNEEIKASNEESSLNFVANNPEEIKTNMIRPDSPLIVAIEEPMIISQ